MTTDKLIDSLQPFEPALQNTYGMLIRAFVRQDAGIDKEPKLRLYTDDGRGNGELIATIPWTTS